MTRWPRIVVGAVAVVTALGALLADVVVPDLAAQHAFNDAWPPHARFHDAQYVVMSVLLGARSLALLAADLGFADQAHLTRTVREHTGHTPAALRRALGQTDSAAARSGLR